MLAELTRIDGRMPMTPVIGSSMSRMAGWISSFAEGIPHAARLLMWVAFSGAVAELIGYFLHRLLHSETISYLSRNHMLHHLKHYGPFQPMRHSGEYADATDERFALGNVGLEWIGPSAMILGLFLWAFAALHASWLHRTMFVAIALGWSIFMFSYLHDRMHVHGFWMERHRRLRKWFLHARRLHDNHHHSLDDGGRMNRNFGIGFHMFDRVF
jgi:hypothetical protein